MQDYYTLKEAAAFLRMSEDAFRKKILGHKKVEHYFSGADLMRIHNGGLRKRSGFNMHTSPKTVASLARKFRDLTAEIADLRARIYRLEKDNPPFVTEAEWDLVEDHDND